MVKQKRSTTTKTSGKKMTKAMAETIVGKNIEISAYGDDLTGLVDSVNLINGKAFLRLNMKKGSLGILVSDIKNWKISGDQNQDKK